MAGLNERALVERLESANAGELALLLARPTVEEEKAYRAYLGNERYQRQHELAVQVAAEERGLFGPFRGAPTPTKKQGNLVVLPGSMGSELESVDRAGSAAQIWLNIPRIIAGQVERLRLTADGRSEADPQYDVRASGILKSYYGELLLSLSRNWNVRAFWYDWRKDLTLAADDLRAKIGQWFGDEPVHLVAHSMGGLVARTFISRHADQWKTMWDADSKVPGVRGGRLIMLGTPNHGAYLIPQAATGLAGTIRKLELVDPWHDMPAILRIVNSFFGLFQMLPSPKFDFDAGVLYDPKTYVSLGISETILTQARNHHENVLDQSGDPDRMVYIAGDKQPTLIGIVKGKPINEGDSYLYTTEGDGSVSHKLGRLQNVKTYVVVSEHSALTSNKQVLGALDALLQGQKVDLPDLPLPTREVKEQRFGADTPVAKAYSERIEEDLERLREVAPRARSRSLAAVQLADEAELRAAAERLWTGFGSDEAAAEARRLRNLADRIEAQQGAVQERISSSEREIADLMTREFVGQTASAKAPPAGPAEPVGPAGPLAGGTPPSEMLTIEVRLVHGSIGDNPIPGTDEPGVPPVDAIAVGYYRGYRPETPGTTLGALDEALSQQHDGGKPKRRLLRDFADRRILRGELGQPFFLDDPRTPSSNRIIAIAGMGTVGSCGVPELTVLVRELCWALGQLGKKHLATVLIGAGDGNLSHREAVETWFRGLNRALSGYQDQPDLHLQRITFVENDRLKLRLIQRAVRELPKLEDDVIKLKESEIKVKFRGIDKDKLKELEEAGLKDQYEEERRKREQRWQQDEKQSGGGTEEPEPANQGTVRMVVTMKRDPSDRQVAQYCFSAMTDEASIPARDIIIDPRIVEQANNELSGENDPERQQEGGHCLADLLLPKEFRSHLSSTRPLVLVLDAATARIHWEMVAQPDPILGEGEEGENHDSGDHREYLSYFLGTYRGLTRQLRTVFASPPEPAMNHRRVLRVLVVADPAEDAPLEGAEAEGIAVAELFERYDAMPPDPSRIRVQVTRLLGPRQATRTNVLHELLVRPYDVLHYAGHCFYNMEQPMLSGWVFGHKNREILSANELRRIDRVPRFIFSNACESGITPDRSEERTPELVPSFAEAFFERGVTNLVCTAWPVNDTGALKFALTLYQELLGIQVGPDGKAFTHTTAPMYLAMQTARRAIAQTTDGRKTWGAYQHYGNPFYSLLGRGPAST